MFNITMGLFNLFLWTGLWIRHGDAGGSLLYGLTLAVLAFASISVATGIRQIIHDE